MNSRFQLEYVWQSRKGLEKKNSTKKSCLFSLCSSLFPCYFFFFAFSDPSLPTKHWGNQTVEKPGISFSIKQWRSQGFFFHGTKHILKTRVRLSASHCPPLLPSLHLAPPATRISHLLQPLLLPPSPKTIVTATPLPIIIIITTADHPQFIFKTVHNQTTYFCFTWYMCNCAQPKQVLSGVARKAKT